MKVYPSIDDYNSRGESQPGYTQEREGTDDNLPDHSMGHKNPTA